MQHEIDELDSDLEEDAWGAGQKDLPGVKQAKNMIKRRTKLAVRVKCIKFSPDGTSFAAATTEGLIMYSNKLGQWQKSVFDPVLIDQNVTLENIINSVKQEEFLKALVLAIRLNQQDVILAVFKSIPVQAVPLLCSNFPKPLLSRFMELLANQLDYGKDLEWNNEWLYNLLKF